MVSLYTYLTELIWETGNTSCCNKHINQILLKLPQLWRMNSARKHSTTKKICWKICNRNIFPTDLFRDDIFKFEISPDAHCLQNSESFEKKKKHYFEILTFNTSETNQFSIGLSWVIISFTDRFCLFCFAFLSSPSFLTLKALMPIWWINDK